MMPFRIGSNYLMESVKLYQVDAFTDKLFHGNPAAVCFLQYWLNDELMLAIALENNLSETAFIVEKDAGYDIRWFTPNGEIELCGHATLAASFAIFEQRKDLNEITFSSLSGELKVYREDKFIVLDFPLLQYEPIPTDMMEGLINKPILEAYCSPKDWVVIVEDEESVRQTQVNFSRLLSHEMQGLIVTAPCDDVDFYSRCFYPKHKIPEDPVTGAAHCLLTPLWAEKLDKTSFVARQGLHRQGTIYCQLNEQRVLLKGECRLFLKGTIEL